VAHSAIRADLRQPLDRLLALAAEVTFDLQVAVDVALEPGDLLVGQVANLGVAGKVEFDADLARRRLADPENVGEADLEPLLRRDVDAGDSGPGLALPLLVAGIAANNHGRAMPLDHAAALAHRLDGCSDLHRYL
jgi:hypothetical protein